MQKAIQNSLNFGLMLKLFSHTVQQINRQVLINFVCLVVLHTSIIKLSSVTLSDEARFHRIQTHLLFGIFHKQTMQAFVKLFDAH